MIWNEFRIQAKQDLVSSRMLFQHNDYGNSAYLLQQSLEKYVKAYFFKFELFIGSPHEFRHLPLIKMWELLVNNVEKKIKSCNKESRDLFQKSTMMLKLVENYFVKIKDSHDKRLKHGAWKSSLGVPLNQSETGVIIHFKNDMESKLLPLMKDAHQISLRILNQAIPVIKSSPQRKHIVENLVRKITNSSLDEILNQTDPSDIDLNNIVEKTSMWFTQIEEIIKELVKGADNRQIILQHDLMKLLLLAWIFALRNEIIMTYPHEEMGRYPEIIDGISTRQFYENNKSSLGILIEQVSIYCKKVEQMLEL